MFQFLPDIPNCNKCVLIAKHKHHDVWDLNVGLEFCDRFFLIFYLMPKICEDEDRNFVLPKNIKLIHISIFVLSLNRCVSHVTIVGIVRGKSVGRGLAVKHGSLTPSLGSCSLYLHSKWEPLFPWLPRY